MVQTPLSTELLYPDSDGLPMAENTEQYEWIVRLVTNLKHLLKDEEAFVAGDLLWYPVQVDQPPAPCQAPDAMVAFGRPPGYRGSYKQWEENNIAPQVVFEILSPKNTRREMAEKQKFYERHGVLEAYYYDPERKDFWGFVRENPEEVCTLVTALYLPWTSPRLQIRFELFEDGLSVFYPDGREFRKPEAALLAQEQAQAKLNQALAKLQELGIDPDTL
jgi:Uma2 family endonuclease